ncbi:unnamed protein product [Paramecium sonneborni]|uniref:MORN repeat protein n=1 Tax=Paramecium sonneborni TaxID=65129 RepID=A0A8S1R9Q2_9CILI|nr:unnamed protein product [Paramecium sonneborni]
MQQQKVIYCVFHNETGLTSICTVPHQCQRKLCVRCLDEHNVDLKYIQTYLQFYELCKQKLQEHKLEDRTEINQLRQSFKCFISEAENQMKNLLEELKELIKNIFDMIEKEDLTYINLVKENTNPLESSLADLQRLVLISNGSILVDWEIKKQTYFQKLDQAKNWLEVEIKSFNDRCKNEMKEIVQIMKQEFNVNFQSIQLQQIIPNEQKEKQKQEIKEIRSYIYDIHYKRYINTKFDIIYKEKEVVYIKDGAIMRTDLLNYQPYEILTNLEQIKFFEWVGQYGNQGQKIGKWRAKLKNEFVEGLGGEYKNDGKKTGQWKEIFQNYWSESIGYEFGEYSNDNRVGNWKYIYKGKEIGGGQYNQKGQRFGKWIELSINSSKQSLVTFISDYNELGQKIGKWEIKQEGEKIGGGLYVKLEEGGIIKSGKWIVLSEGFTDNFQVTYCGEYNTKGGKKGRWELMEKGEHFYSKYNQFGGGWYDEQEGCSIKVGQWIEIRDGCNDSRKLIFSGQYNEKGQKKGKWDIIYKGKIIGGGQYQEQENGSKKIGDWTDVHEGFYEKIQIIYKGKYNLRGQKQGKWDTFSVLLDWQTEPIGGGLYDDQVRGSIKIGNWIELWDQYGYTKEILQVGQYDEKGQKIGRWQFNTFCKDVSGGGCYEVYEGVSKKNGSWVEFSQDFKLQNQVAFSGEYCEGKKVGKWDVIKWDLFNNKQIMQGEA